MQSQLKKYRDKHEFTPEEKQEVMNDMINSILDIEDKQSDRRRSKSSRKRSRESQKSHSWSPNRTEHQQPSQMNEVITEEIVEFGSGNQ